MHASARPLMAKRSSTAASKASAAIPRSRMKAVATSSASTETPDGAAEQRVLAFAEQLGYVAGTIQQKTTGWMDRETLGKQLASVRDGAVSLLEYLERATGLKSATRQRTRRAGRSGGVVDAPGKKHRKPAPADPRIARANSQTVAKMRMPDRLKKASRPQARG